MVWPFRHLYNEEKPQKEEETPRKEGKKLSWKEFVSDSVNKRNELVHIDNETEINYPELMALSSKLDALFQLHFLKLCGVDESVDKRLGQEASA